MARAAARAAVGAAQRAADRGTWAEGFEPGNKGSSEGGGMKLFHACGGPN